MTSEDTRLLAPGPPRGGAREGARRAGAAATWRAEAPTVSGRHRMPVRGPRPATDASA